MSKTASEGSLARYAASRLATAVLVLIGSMALLCSADARSCPATPPPSCSGRAPRRETVAIFREQMGLDLPIHERVFVFFLHAVQGDLGVDVLNGRPVADMVIAALPNTLLLAVSAIGLAVLIGIPIGCYAAVRPGSLLDQALAVVSVGLVATPSYVVAILLLYFFSVRLGWFPVLGAGDPGNYLDQLHHLVLPTAGARRRLDRLHRAAGALLAARSAGRALHPHRPRLRPAGTPRRHEIRAEARLHPDRRHPRRRHRRADGRGGVRRDHLQPAGPRLADLRRHPQPQLSDRAGRHSGRRRDLRR